MGPSLMLLSPALSNTSGEARAIAVLSELEEEKMSDFVKSEKLPLTIEFSKGNSEKIFNSGIPKQLILWGSSNDLSDGAEVRKESFRGAEVQFASLRSRMLGS